MGLNKYGLDLLVCNKQVKKIICSFLGENKNIVQEYFNGHLTLELVPQGSFAEKLRAAGAGIPAFYTSTGIGTIIGDGGVVQKFSPGGSEFEKVSIHKEMRIFNGQPYMLVHSIKSDYAFVKGHTADELGNVTFNKSAMNFNVDVAKSGKK